MGVSALVLVAAVRRVWYLFIRDDGGSASADSSPPGRRPAGPGRARRAAPDQAAVPDDVPQIDKSAHTVAVFNASGIDGVAGDIVAPALENEGYQVPLVANPPDGDRDRQKSVVMYRRGSARRPRTWPRTSASRGRRRSTGTPDDQVGDADVIVLVGMDIANRGIAATP